MSTLIGKFSKNGKSYYFDYSTQDGVASPAMELKAYREHYLKLHGRIGLSKLPERLERADQKGTSSRTRRSLEEMVKGNRAGEGQAELSVDELIEQLLGARTSNPPAP